MATVHLDWFESGTMVPLSDIYGRSVLAAHRCAGVVPRPGTSEVPSLDAMVSLPTAELDVASCREDPNHKKLVQCPAPRQQVVVIITQRLEFRKGFVFQMQLIGPDGGYPSNTIDSLIGFQQAVRFCWLCFQNGREPSEVCQAFTRGFFCFCLIIMIKSNGLQIGRSNATVGNRSIRLNT